MQSGKILPGMAQCLLDTYKMSVESLKQLNKSNANWTMDIAYVNRISKCKCNKCPDYHCVSKESKCDARRKCFCPCSCNSSSEGVDLAMEEVERFALYHGVQVRFLDSHYETIDQTSTPEKFNPRIFPNKALMMVDASGGTTPIIGSVKRSLNHRQQQHPAPSCQYCAHEGCSKQPRFNMEGLKMGLYCTHHKETGMVDVIIPRCAHEGCNTNPTFNRKGQGRGLYCLKHKETDMVDVVNPHCVHEECKTRALFNKEGEKRGLYCNQHKEKGMVCVLPKFVGPRNKPYTL